MRLVTLPGVPGRGSYTVLTSYLSAGTSVIASTPLHISCQNARGFGAPGKRQPMPIIAIGSIFPPFYYAPKHVIRRATLRCATNLLTGSGVGIPCKRAAKTATAALSSVSDG